MISENGLVIINEIIRSVSRAENTEIFRKICMEKLKKLVNFNLAVFDVCKNSYNKTLLYDPVVLSEYNEEFEKKFIYEYDTKYAGMSYSRWLHSEEKCLVMRDSDLLNKEIRSRSRYYKEYVKKNGFEYVVNCEYAYNSINFACLTLYRDANLGDFTDNEVNYLDLLTPCIISGINRAIDYNVSDSKCNFMDDLNLTDREKDIINLVYEGKTNKEIADASFVTENTVKKHLSNIYRKMNIKNRSKLISYLNVQNYREYK
jgi:DNA-binding CsgD family transcriptional regulator